MSVKIVTGLSGAQQEEYVYAEKFLVQPNGTLVLLGNDGCAVRAVAPGFWMDAAIVVSVRTDTVGSLGGLVGGSKVFS